MRYAARVMLGAASSRTSSSARADHRLRKMRRHGVAELELLIAPAAVHDKVIGERHQALELCDTEPS